MLRVSQRVKRATLHAVITRANGSIENLGMLGYTSSNPIKRNLMNALLSVKRAYNDLKRRIK